MKNLARGLPLLALLLLLMPQCIAQGLEGLKLQGEEFTYKFNPNKELINGIIIKPSGDGPFPAVVVNHGGGGDAKKCSHNEGSNFVQKSYVVIACDLTHSGKRDGGKKSTFGGSQENADRIMACVNVLESLPYVDAKKLCIYGISMGAFATIGTCTQTDKFKAAAISAGGVGGNSGLGSLCDEGNVPKITTPFISCHGGDDDTVPLESAKKFKAIMDANNRISELHIFEGIGHGVCKVKAVEVYALILEFFEKHLK